MTLHTPLPRARQRRRSPLPVILGVVALMTLVAVIAFGNLGKSLEYFVTPTEYMQQRAELEGRPLRIGGLVKAVRYNPQTLDLNFQVTDGGATFPVQYRGAVSDLFKENQGVVVRGEFQGSTFHASELVVKHSEEYRVPQSQADLKNLLRQSE